MLKELKPPGQVAISIIIITIIGLQCSVAKPSLVEKEASGVDGALGRTLLTAL